MKKCMCYLQCSLYWWALDYSKLITGLIFSYRMKYIEEQLSKRKSKIKEEMEEGKVQDDTSRYLSPEEAALQAVPEHLRASSTRRSEEMLSNQMLSGIPEVDLGIEYVSSYILEFHFDCHSNY